MRVARSPRFLRNFSSLPELIQKKFNKQLFYLLSDFRHPSLRTKKFDETQGIWQARVDDHFRFYFQMDGDIYILVNILPHLD